MRQHAFSISHVAPHERGAAEPAPQEVSFFRGLFFGILFSIPIWGLIIWGAYELFR